MVYKAIHTYDALPSKRDDRDFKMMAVDTSTLPEIVALPKVPVLDQSSEGSCVGHGCAGAREVLEVIANGAAPMTPLSRAFIYYQARLMEGTANQDSGAQVRDGCKVLNEIGVCTEDQFPYRVGGFADVPPDLDTTAAAQFKIDSYTRLVNTAQVRVALASGSPVVIGISVYQSFETQIGPDGVVPIPDRATEQLLGGHCVFLWGYHPDPKSPGMYLLDGSNSWSSRWGDSGHIHFPQNYLDNPNLCSDMWQVSLAVAPPPPPPPPPTPPPPQPGYTDPVTGHTLSGDFLAYYKAKGGLEILGRPVAQQEVSAIPADRGMIVQYLERARLELHPEIADPTYRVLATSWSAMVAQRIGHRGLGIDGVLDCIPDKQ